MTVWRTKEGEEIPIKVKTSHLCNAIEMLKRHAAQHLKRAGFPESNTYRIFPIVQELESEIARRLNAQQTEAGEEHITVIRGRLLELE